MKIIKFQAQNIKRLGAVEIVPDGSVVRITGRNGSGKSSVLDAIYMALAGEGATGAKPVRNGEAKAFVKLDMGEIAVTRRFTDKGTAVMVEQVPTGARFPSPQRMLDELLGQLTFDPLEFARMKPFQQAETLRKLVNLDVSAFTNRMNAAYDARTETNRRVKSLTERVVAIDTEIDPGADTTPIDVSALLERMESAVADNSERQDDIKRRQDQDTQLAGLIREFRELDEQIQRLQRRRAEVHQESVTLQASIDEREPLPEIVDTTELRRQIEDAQLVNRQRQQQAQIRDIRTRIAGELTAAKAEADNFTAIIDEFAAKKQAAIAKAAFPVAGLSFAGDGSVTYNGVPFAQASSAEQLIVSVRLAMAMNPKLRVLRVQDGSLLDEDSLRTISEMAEAEDYQVWMEVVDETAGVGIHLEDGHVVAVNGAPVEPEAAVAAAE